MLASDDELTPIDGSYSGPSVLQVAGALRRGMRVSDRWFDRFLPLELSCASAVHWTPLVVVARVAQWLKELGVETVVDIGSGAGKFCVATALASGCRFIGLEQRPRLVRAGRSLADLFQVRDRVAFVEGTLGQCVVPAADAYYLYNPFGENLYGYDAHLDDDVELSNSRYDSDVRLTEEFLRQAPVGTYLIKYNGFGGQVPAGYEQVRVDWELPNVLRVWHKTGAGA